MLHRLHRGVHFFWLQYFAQLQLLLRRTFSSSCGTAPAPVVEHTSPGLASHDAPALEVSAAPAPVVECTLHLQRLAQLPAPGVGTSLSSGWSALLQRLSRSINPTTSFHDGHARSLARKYIACCLRAPSLEHMVITELMDDEAVCSTCRRIMHRLNHWFVQFISRGRRLCVSMER